MNHCEEAQIWQDFTSLTISAVQHSHTAFFFLTIYRWICPAPVISVHGWLWRELLCLNVTSSVMKMPDFSHTGRFQGSPD